MTINDLKTWCPTLAASRGGEFSLGKIGRDLKPSDYAPMLIDAYEKYVTDGGTFCFCMDITHAEALAREYNNAGIASAAVTAATSADQRQDAFTQFLTGQIKCLMSVDLFSEGIDLGTIAQMQGINNPQELTAIQMARPTASLRIFLQQIGRVLRYSPGKVALILDHVDNWVRHGSPDDSRRWTLQGEEGALAKKKKEKYAKLPPTERSWRQLGFTPGRTQKLLELDDSAYWSNWLRRHIDTCNERGYKPQWVMHRLTETVKDPPWEMFEAVAQWLTTVSDASKGWAYHQYRKRYRREPPTKPKNKKPYWKGILDQDGSN
jgi:superfamily II DNA or RNA helicase